MRTKWREPEGKGISPGSMLDAKLNNETERDGEKLIGGTAHMN